MHLRLELGSDLARFYTCIYLPGYKTVATGSCGGKTLSLFVDSYNNIIILKNKFYGNGDREGVVL